MNQKLIRYAGAPDSIIPTSNASPAHFLFLHLGVADTGDHLLKILPTVKLLLKDVSKLESTPINVFYKGLYMKKLR